MLPLVKDLHTTLQAQLEAVDPHGNATKQYKAKSEIVEAAILQIKEHLVRNPFPDKATEIEYFKNWLPYFIKLHLYHLALIELELIRKTSTREEFLAHLQDEKKRVSSFFREHRDLYYYHWTGKTEEDEKLFVRDSLSGKRELLEKDPNFCHHSLLVGWLLAYEDYVAVLEKEIASYLTETKPKAELYLSWTGTKAEIVELIIGISECELLENDGQPATAEEIKSWMEYNTNVDLNDFAVIDNNIRNRKTSPTLLLDKMKRAIIVRRGRLDP